MSTIRFPENNRILYGQDFTIKCGVPHDVEFKVVRVDSSYMVLEGPGYGEKERVGCRRHLGVDNPGPAERAYMRLKFDYCVERARLSASFERTCTTGIAGIFEPSIFAGW